MTTLDFSVNVHFLESVRILRQLLEQFQEESRCNVSLHITPGKAAWRSLIYYGLYRRGADISEIGSTWVGELAGINALRAFTPAEIDDIGGEAAFFPTLWQNKSTDDDRTWSVPLLGDTRLIFYWRDMLSHAGVKERTAFETAEQLEDTLRQIKRVHSTPWATQTQADTHDIVYLASSWVWGAGGDFISPDGKRSTFADPKALKGLHSYFNLHTFMPQRFKLLELPQLVELFCQRRVAAMISGPWVIDFLLRNLDDDDLMGQVGVAQPPGPAFVGGSQLGIWQHASQTDDCLALVKYLLTPEVQRQLAPLTGMLPVICSVAEDKDMTSVTPHYEQFLYGLQHGRNPAKLPYWGLLEEHLATAFQQIWSELLENPGADVDETLRMVLEPLAAYLDRVLAR